MRALRSASGVSIDAVFNNDSGYDLFDDDDVSQRYGAFIGHDLLMLSDKLVLGAELGFGYERSHRAGWSAARSSTNLSTTTFFGALGLRYVLLPWLQPQARLAVGVSALSMQLSSVSDGVSNDADDELSPFGSLGAGFLLRTPTRALETREGKLRIAVVRRARGSGLRAARTGRAQPRPRHERPRHPNRPGQARRALTEWPLRAHLTRGALLITRSAPGYAPARRGGL